MVEHNNEGDKSIWEVITVVMDVTRKWRDKYEAILMGFKQPRILFNAVCQRVKQSKEMKMIKKDNCQLLKVAQT